MMRFLAVCLSFLARQPFVAVCVARACLAFVLIAQQCKANFTSGAQSICGTACGTVLREIARSTVSSAVAPRVVSASCACAIVLKSKASFAFCTYDLVAFLTICIFRETIRTIISVPIMCRTTFYATVSIFILSTNRNIAIASHIFTSCTEQY